MLIESLQSDPPFFFAVVITVVLSICIHELAHGVIAIWHGDRTPITEGHMTFNPLVHMGMFSIITLLIAGIAWGAMPIDPTRMRGKYAEAKVAVAGPVSNVLLALIALTALGLWWRHDGYTTERGTPAGNLQFFLGIFGYVNVMLALFNMIPIPPLDGSKILENFSDGYKRLTEQLSANGGSTVVFILAFVMAGRVISPAAQQIRFWYVELVSGLDLVVN